MSDLEAFEELLTHPGWEVYLDLVEEELLALFRQIFALDPTKPESFVKFVEIKGQIDKLRNITYDYERQMAKKPEAVEVVDSKYTSRFRRILDKIF